MRKVLIATLVFRAAVVTTCLTACLSTAHAQTVTASIDASKTSAPINKRVYGQFLEHIGNLVNTGLWAELLDLFNDLPGAVERPYFVMVFNLGIQDSNSAAVSARSNVENLKPGDPQRDGYPCFWIEVTGSSMAFNEDIVSDGFKLRSILASDSVMEVVTDTEIAASIKNRKSAFSAGPECYGWAEDLDVFPTPGIASA